MNIKTFMQRHSVTTYFGMESPYRLGLLQHEQCVVGPAHACKLHRLPGHSRAYACITRTRNAVVCGLCRRFVDFCRSRRRTVWQRLSATINAGEGISLPFPSG